MLNKKYLQYNSVNQLLCYCATLLFPSSAAIPVHHKKIQKHPSVIPSSMF